MEIYGLSGKSGTGKSYHSGELCARYNIRGLIDDGLFMYDGNIIAGISAKKQATSIAAIKTALFTDERHCVSVREAIARLAPDRILVIGTSDKMIKKICDRLRLGTITQTIYIEDITTSEQREKAKRFREEGGMHVIPAPTLQVKKQFSGYFLDPRRSFGSNKSIEKTIVRPTYSYLGDYIISDRVVGDIVNMMAKNNPGIAEVIWTSFDNDESGCVVRTVVRMNKDSAFRSCAEQLQKSVMDMVAEMTAFNVLGVEVEIKGYK